MKQSNDHLKLLVLLLILIFLTVLVSVDRSTLAQATPDKETIKKSGEKIETPPASGQQRELAPAESNISIASIAEKNIFNPERRDFPVQAGLKPVARPRIILYGVTIAGDYQSASVVNPGRSLHKGERETITLRIGEQIGGYKLAKVWSDRITMEAEGDSFEVLLYDSREVKKRGDAKTDNRPTAVTNPFGVPVEAPTPTPPTTAEKPRVAVQERVSTPTPIPSPAPPLIPPSGFRLGRRIYVPPEAPAPQGSPATQGVPAPTQPGVPTSPGTSPQGTGGN
ncbi:MAG: hypothetical protein ABSH06_13425 [Thermodesulfobacteriota bacterium]|jgi:hypothetical protein